MRIVVSALVANTKKTSAVETALAAVACSTDSNCPKETSRTCAVIAAAEYINSQYLGKIELSVSCSPISRAHRIRGTAMTRKERSQTWKHRHICHK